MPQPPGASTPSTPSATPSAPSAGAPSELEVLEPEPVASNSDSDSDSETDAASGGETSADADASSATGGADAEQIAEAGGGPVGSEGASGSVGAAGPEGMQPGTAGSGTSALDERLEASLEGFEGELAGQMTILASVSPPPGSEDELEEGAGSNGEESDDPPLDQTGDAPGLVLVNDPSMLPPSAGERAARGATATSGTIGEEGLGGAGSRREGSSNSAMVSSRVPSDIGDGSDDDVVSRQIREAAMNESDPVLREKLWQEYRNYKKSLR